MPGDLRSAPPPPPAAAAMFGERLPLAVALVTLLADEGVLRGLLGPREVPRLWERHLLNCAVVAPEFPRDAVVLDVGSGAGLPGLVLAIARPDLRLTLIEPMQRRVTWLEYALGRLELDTVIVRRSRAESLWNVVEAPYVTARAVAPLAGLATACAPLLGPGGTLVAMKGRSAQDEVDRDRAALRELGLHDILVRELGGGIVDPVTYVVRASLEPGARSVRPLRAGRQAPKLGSARRSRRQAEG